MTKELHTLDGTLTAYAFACGYVEHTFGELRTITLTQPAPGSPYQVAVLNGIGSRLTRRASFARLQDARKFAKAMRDDMTAPAHNGTDTL